MAVGALPISPQRASGVLLGLQVSDAVAGAIPLEVLRQELERLGCPPWLQRTIPVVKGVSAVGLLGLTLIARRAYTETDVIDLTAETGTLDATPGAPDVAAAPAEAVDA